jgi:hypothetical protein
MNDPSGEVELLPGGGGPLPSVVVLVKVDTAGEELVRNINSDVRRGVKWIWMVVCGVRGKGIESDLEWRVGESKGTEPIGGSDASRAASVVLEMLAILGCSAA